MSNTPGSDLRGGRGHMCTCPANSSKNAFGSVLVVSVKLVNNNSAPENSYSKPVEFINVVIKLRDDLISLELYSLLLTGNYSVCKYFGIKYESP